jgi:diadenosine tetraphosphate (Ap4A) HIT family hydrolase
LPRRIAAASSACCSERICYSHRIARQREKFHIRFHGGDFDVNKLAVVPCELCDSASEAVLWRNELCRVVLVDEPGYAGFCRVILNRHVKEMTDLDAPTRLKLMCVVFAVEQALRELMRPAKINLASLGNRVAHLHWHVIPRFADDPHFPASVWSHARRSGAPRALERAALQLALHKSLQAVAE